jgi:hypothetical protein
MFKLETLKSLFLIICISLPSLLYGVEVCKIPSGCQIDDKGFCVGCIEQDFEEETEEEILEKKIEEEKEQEERERFWKNVFLRIYGTHASHTFSFVGMNNSKIGRPYINEVTYSGFSIGTRLRLDSKFSYSISSFRGSTDTVILNSDDESISSLSDNTFTTEMSGDLSYTDVTIDYNWNVEQWNWFLGLGVINYESDLIYRDLTYGSFKYEIDEQSVFLNSGIDYDFLQSNTFLGLGFRVVGDSTHKSNSTDKKITQYNSSYTSPMVKLRIITTSISFGMSF